MAPLLQPKLRSHMTDAEVRLETQNLIDNDRLRASIIYKGHVVWSRRRILLNLYRIIRLGRLGNGKPVLSKYFYAYIVLVCGSDAHEDINGWVRLYPTIKEFKEFFRKNERGKAVTEYIPEWKAARAYVGF